MSVPAIITGASRGIGAAIARDLAAHGYHPVLVARDVAALEVVAGAIQAAGGTSTTVPCDVSRSADIAAALDTMGQQFGTLPRILVSNAGWGGPYHAADAVSEAEWDAVFDTNVKAAFLWSRALLPHMQAGGFGRIVCIGSVFGRMGGALSAAYSASKHALAGYSRSVALEWGAFGITCNVVSPGYIATAMGAPDASVLRRIPAGRQGSPEEIARVVRFLLEPDSGYINGADIAVDGGLGAGFSLSDHNL